MFRLCLCWCSLCSRKKLASLKSKNCDKIMFWFEQKFCLLLRETMSRRKKNLNSSFIWLFFCVMQAVKVSPRHSFAHTSPKMVTIILCFKSKSFSAETQFHSFLFSNREEKYKLKDGKIIGTIFKVNQNQITSKFHNSNHSTRFSFFVT